MHSSRACLALMLKYPCPGRVKTRLGKDIGQANAALLYRCFVQTTLATCRTLSWPILLFCHQDRKLEHYRAWLGEGHDYFTQGPGNIGDKMRSAFEQAFALGFDRVILAGTDMPQMPRETLQQAVQGIEKSKAVLGPALDGGYYLLGLSRENFDPGLFSAVPWSTSRVLEITMNRLKDLGLNPHILPELRDVDTLEDFKALFRSQQGVEPDSYPSWDQAVQAYLACMDCNHSEGIR
ncbi:TIGR04282 family arsenosugar biosynthesis glycosyltransferase [Desulfonatronospira sp.]|uniref:TIGR04282 family arsenosugar biosynthesis glycosyltransferase n=1 Tax=Desulfonatronospira sp. TaxID=1962951 RepID=UPI0025C5052F|nr:TIGR04282 family arsenosugar biosynthesis glycosyltransferase [Desulfonatronospira sp.]